MQIWKSIIVDKKELLIDVMKKIDKTSLQFAVVTNKGKLVGTVTDGDIRRGLLSGKSLDVSIHEIMNSSPTYVFEDADKSSCFSMMSKNKLKQLPVLNYNREIVDILFMDDFEELNRKENVVILMLGGLGTRLRPLTNFVPKPMLKIGDKPILETITEGFKNFGYRNFIFSVNYKKEVIQNYFQNGEAFGMKIDYVEEQNRMGTAGALSLIENRPTKPFFVMNGDLLTQVNFDQLMQFHLEHDAFATMCVREYEFQIPYGVIKTEGTDLVAIKEKPIHRSFVNAGIYVLSPEVFDYIPHDEFYDMPTLFEALINAGKKTSVFPIHEYWLDIGQMDDFHRATEEYKEFADEA